VRALTLVYGVEAAKRLHRLLARPNAVLAAVVCLAIGINSFQLLHHSGR
jgi:hypothetical protein